MGEIIPAALTAPLAAALRAGWELTLAAWAVPVAVTAAAVALATPHVRRDSAAPPARWWPDWRSAETWYLGLIFGAASAVYWGTNAFIPDYLHVTGRPQLVAPALTALNGGQIPASVLIGALSSRMVAQRWPFVAAGVLTVAALAGFLAMPSAWVVAWASVFGFTAGAILVLTLALPPLLVPPEDVHRLSAAMFTVTYSCSFLAPLVAGAAWDATHLPWVAFAPVGLAGAAIVVLARLVRLPDAGLSEEAGPAPPRAAGGPR